MYFRAPARFAHTVRVHYVSGFIFLSSSMNLLTHKIKASS